MKLEEYLKKNNMNGKEFAKLHSLNFKSIYNWLTGRTKPLKSHIALIKKLTNGKVTEEDWENSS